jgi:hypothetical protein
VLPGRPGRSCSRLLWDGLGVPAGSSAAGDANEAACPNESLEGFREYLPDCRAYEMVSPAFKNGYATNVQGVSADGSRVLMVSGSFGDAVGDGGEEPSEYVLTRSGSGWMASAVDPPASSLPFQRLWAVSGDLGRTLWEARDASQSDNAADLYVREADGLLVKIGPMVPPSAAAGPPAGGDLSNGLLSTPVEELSYAGSSSDLSHLLFQVASQGALWPGDITDIEVHPKTSLYEYVGTGNTRPGLVGVDGEGHLISDCATSLGAPEMEDTYGAVSASGETVFFTAEGHNSSACRASVSAPAASELYARLGGVETVAISEPTPGQCEACQTGVRAPAVFQGASEDGSKVFFLTEQELLPGAGGRNLYEYDFDNPPGRRVLRVSVGSASPEVLGVSRVSRDGSHVYFVARGVLSEGANAEGEEPVAGGDNLYVFERDTTYPMGHVAFIGTLAAADSPDWQEEDRRPVQATPDGRFLVFDSVADLTPEDASNQEQVFEYDALSGRLVRVSVAAADYPAGHANAEANASYIEIQEYGKEGNARPGNDVNLAVSDDGSVVVFNSYGALTGGAQEAAAAGASSVYVYRSAGSIVDGGVYLVSSGRNASKAESRGLSASGGDLFFRAPDALVTGDVDTQVDLYDARVDGGFPVVPPPVVCKGEACQGAPGPATLFAAPGSVSGVAGNLTPPPPSSPPGVGSVPKVPRPSSRAQKLARALRACPGKPKRRRVVCEAQARRRYGVRSNGRGKGAR